MYSPTPVLGDVLQEHQSPSAEGTPPNPEGDRILLIKPDLCKIEKMPRETLSIEVKALQFTA